jgi:hypothetical protein
MLPYSLSRPRSGTRIAVLCAVAVHAVILGAIVSGERGAPGAKGASTAHTLDDPIGKASGLGGARPKRGATNYMDEAQAAALVGTYRLTGAGGTLLLTITSANERMEMGPGPSLVLWAQDSVRGRKRLVFERESVRFSYEFDPQLTLTIVPRGDSTVATLGGRERPPLVGPRIRVP